MKLPFYRPKPDKDEEYYNNTLSKLERSGEAVSPAEFKEFLKTGGLVSCDAFEVARHLLYRIETLEAEVKFLRKESK